MLYFKGKACPTPGHQHPTLVISTAKLENIEGTSIALGKEAPGADLSTQVPPEPLPKC